MYPPPNTSSKNGTCIMGAVFWEEYSSQNNSSGTIAPHAPQSDSKLKYPRWKYEKLQIIFLLNSLSMTINSDQNEYLVRESLEKA